MGMYIPSLHTNCSNLQHAKTMCWRLPALCGGSRVAAQVRIDRPVQRESRIKGVAGGASLCSVNDGSGLLMFEMGGGTAGMKDGGRQVTVVADGRAEAMGALQWALSHAVRSNDTIVLLVIVKQAPQAGGFFADTLGTRCYQLDAMRIMCESIRPEVKMAACAVKAVERAPAVVEAARRHGASLLVLGQRQRRAATRWLQALWWRPRGRGGAMVEYCIEHASCLALGVRQRSSGGYLVSSKRYKDFWHLA